jgi:hypothetical protein
MRLELPLVPSIVVLHGGKSNGFLWLGPREVLVAQFASKISRQNRMVRLANQDKMIAAFLNDHFAALIRSDGLRARLAG